ncbi:MAG TPA: carbon-nitrogen hydrolase family protein [Deltaproteobacteria bacterium]|nr:carbon-nitrogen hydrolase family protein [Deltaproteobacteria bacterium]
MSKTMKAGAIQLCAELGNVTANLEKADRLVEEAASQGARIIILPEFFTTAAAFHPAMLKAALPIRGRATQFLMDKARKHQAYVGGSFIASRNGELFNTFVLAMPDGSTAYHDKDQPTMWENCYYTGGRDDGILPTPIGPIGAVLCWEHIRHRTARRLLGRVDLVVGGSCWWTVPQGWPPKGLWEWHHRKNMKLMASTPSTLARMLGVPLVHAAHAGTFRASMPCMPLVPYESFYLGETQIVDASGVILRRMTREEGEGVIVAEVDPGRRAPSLTLGTSFWIPRLPLLFRLVWTYQNLHGAWYYHSARKSGALVIP